MRKEVQLNESTIEYLKSVQEKEGLHNFSDALEFAVLKCSKMDNKEKDDELLITKLLEKYEEKYKLAFTRIRLGSNTADRNSQVIIEILNAIAYQLDISPITTSANETEVVKISKQEVKNRIEYFKQKKDNKSKK